MKPIIFLLCSLFIFNCSIVDKNNPDFIFILTFYNKENIEISKIFYDSQTGIFKNGRPEEVIVKLDNKEKQEINNLKKELHLNSNSCWIKSEDGTSSKSDFITKASIFKRVKCDSINNEEVNKHLMIYAKILRMLRAKKEYREKFPEEFEVL